MTDTITPEPTADDYRAAEKVLRAARFGGFRGGYDDEADWCKEEAARLEAESARDEEAETLAKLLGEAYEEHSGLTSTGWDGYSDVAKDRWRHLAAKALDFLAADGRLLPEGEERTVYDDTTLKRVYRGLAAAGIEIRQAVDVVNQIQNQGILFRQSPDDGWIDPPAVSVPDSGPDGTPEKPWPTWQDVPEGVRYVSSDGCYCFVNRNGSRFPAGQAGESKFRSSFSDVVMDSLAPFVRVDGDKA